MEKRVSIFSDNSSDSEVDFDINTNNTYAHGYDKWRLKEDLQKHVSKNGGIGSSSSSSESEEEDVPLIEKNFLKTLSLLKSNDPKIYDTNVEFFDESEKPEIKPKAKKSKPLYMKEYERKQLLEKNWELSDDDEDKVPFDLPSTYDKEQQEIKNSFKLALAESESGEESENDLFQVRKKDNKEKERDEAEYIRWLKGEKDNLPIQDADKDLKYLHDYWNDPNLEDDEQFLKDYILNKKFAKEDSDSDAIPTYEEITKDVGTLSDDDKVLEKQAVFEQKYNFRFEEPDPEFIKEYPRIIGSSLRRTDTRRQLKREEYQERKRQEKEQKKEEIKRLKALKRAEIEEMLKKLKETSGDDKLSFDYADIDEDFDPDAHDKRMKELFNEDYYGVEEADKPELPCDEEFDDENWDDWTREEAGYSEEGPHCEDPDFNMDADYDPRLQFQQQMIDSLSKKKKKRKKSKFAEVVAAAKPLFDPSSKKLEEYIDEYYNLDCEDVIGGETFRFKYRNVVANDFGLSANEILKARDKELNRWCSIKKTCQYRNEEEENYDLVAFRRKTETGAKKKFLPSLYDEVRAENAEASPTKKSRKQKRRLKKMNESNASENSGSKDEVTNHEPPLKRRKIEDTGETTTESHNNSTNDRNESAAHVPSTSGEHSQFSNVEKKKKRKKKKRKSSSVVAESGQSNVPIHTTNRKHPNQDQGGMNKQNSSVDKRLQLSDARLKAYGINPKKFKNRIKYSKKAKHV